MIDIRIDPFTACGILGAACFIAAYFLTLRGWMDPTGWRFPAINLAGAVLVLISLLEAWNLPSVLLECFWGAISLYGVLNGWARRRPPSG